MYSAVPDLVSSSLVTAMKHSTTAGGCVGALNVPAVCATNSVPLASRTTSPGTYALPATNGCGWWPLLDSNVPSPLITKPGGIGGGLAQPYGFRHSHMLFGLPQVSQAYLGIILAP